MKFAFAGDKERFEYLKSCDPDSTWELISNNDILSEDADAFFLFDTDASFVNDQSTVKPVFIHSMNDSLTEMNLPPNFIRVNAWPGFLEKGIWEIAGIITSKAEIVLKQLGKKFIPVNDVPGFVTARIIAMIINEAFFAKGENISTEAEIDLAMKLGTNYPHGPFEWGNTIGLKNIYCLLEKLSFTDERYKVAPALKEKSNQL